MQKIQRTIEIKAPVQQVYDYLNQPTTLLSIWPNIVSVSNIVPRSAERDLDTMLGKPQGRDGAHRRRQDDERTRALRQRPH